MNEVQKGERRSSVLACLKEEEQAAFRIWFDRAAGKEERIREELCSVDDEKLPFIFSPQKEIRIDAVSGSGGSRLLFSRLLYLLTSGIDPNRILVILPSAFERKIWHEKLEHFSLDKPVLAGPDAFLWNFLNENKENRSNLERAGRGEGYEYSHLADEGLPDDAELDFRQLQAGTVPELIDRFWLKMYVLFLKSGENTDFAGEKRELLQNAYRHYQVFLEHNRFFDLADLINLSSLVLKDYPESARDRFDHVLMDDAQDYPQKLTGMLALFGKNVFFTGDSRKFPASGYSSQQKLENTYRFSHLMKKFIDLTAKEEIKVKAERESLLAGYYLSETPQDAMKFISFMAAYMREKHKIAFSEMAVLMRNKIGQEALEERLKLMTVPYIDSRTHAVWRELKQADLENVGTGFETLEALAKNLQASPLLLSWLETYERQFPPFVLFGERLENLKVTREKMQEQEYGLSILGLDELAGREFEMLFIPQFEEGIYPYMDLEREKAVLYRIFSRASRGFFLVRADTKRFKHQTTPTRESSFMKKLFPENIFECGDYFDWKKRALKLLK